MNLLYIPFFSRSSRHPPSCLQRSFAPRGGNCQPSFSSHRRFALPSLMTWFFPQRPPFPLPRAMLFNFQMQWRATTFLIGTKSPRFVEPLFVLKLPPFLLPLPPKTLKCGQGLPLFPPQLREQSFSLSLRRITGTLLPPLFALPPLTARASPVLKFLFPVAVGRSLV